MDTTKLKNILEAVLLTTDRPLTVPNLENLFTLDEEQPTRDDIRKALHDLEEDYKEKSMELKQVASGYRIQVKQDYSTWVSRLWEEKPARYSRALLETLALIAYRQPITRGEIEEVRGVSVSSSIIKTLLERDWIKVLGHKDVPGKPSLYGTTKEFLDYFNLKSLEQLPTLAEIKDLDQIHPELALEDSDDNESAQAADEDAKDNAAEDPKDSLDDGLDDSLNGGNDDNDDDTQAQLAQSSPDASEEAPQQGAEADQEIDASAKHATAAGIH